jgi:hypothetical protein
MSNIEKLLAAVLAELKKFTGRMPGADAPGALKRSLAAKKMGISISKLNWRIRVGLTQTCADPHMIPMSEILRFTASQDAETGLEPAADARTIMSTSRPSSGRTTRRRGRRSAERRRSNGLRVSRGFLGS